MGELAAAVRMELPLHPRGVKVLPSVLLQVAPDGYGCIAQTKASTQGAVHAAGLLYIQQNCTCAAAPPGGVLLTEQHVVCAAAAVEPSMLVAAALEMNA